MPIMKAVVEGGLDYDIATVDAASLLLVKSPLPSFRVA